MPVGAAVGRMSQSQPNADCSCSGGTDTDASEAHRARGVGTGRKGFDGETGLGEQGDEILV
jgi:hypothetical protein